MKQVCDFCDGIINDTDEVCPHCGGVNAHVVRSANGVPKTIAELQAYAQAHHLPLQQMRFFIGVNYQQPKAFGIYEENGIFTVYKNKADGTRAIRYQGKDEAYAVNELYQKMHSEIMNQKQHLAQSKSRGGQTAAPRRSSTSLRTWLTIGAVAIVILVMLLSSLGKPRRGYYTYDNEPYYYQSGQWYGYDGDWYPVTPNSGLTDNYGDYYNGSSYNGGSSYDNFEDSDYYNDSWDSDDDWDSNDSWDSDFGDWDSDW